MIGLDTQDNKILDLLGKKSLHVSALARDLVVKRTTITYRLERLKSMGLVQCSVLGKKTVYELKFKKVGQKDHFQVYAGKDFANAYRELLHLPKETTILAIQGKGAAREHIKHIPKVLVSEIHRVFKRKNIILKGISNTDTLKLFEGLEKQVVKSHIGRTMGVKILNDKFNGYGEMMITKKFVLLANPKTMKAILIKEPAIVEMMYDTLVLLFDYLKDVRVFDLNGHLKSIISD